MSRYLNLLYGTDTYGIRTREEINLRAVPLDYSRVEVTVGNIPAGYPVGTRVVLIRSLQYWPVIPGSVSGTLPEFNDETVFEAMEFLTDGNPTLPPAAPFSGVYYNTGFDISDSPARRTAVVGYPGYSNIPPVFIDYLTPGSVVYYRIYVSEPMASTVDVSGSASTAAQLLQQREDALAAASGSSEVSRWTPWEIRGQAYAVVPRDLGGRPTFFDSFPNGILTGGDVYGVPDPESFQMQFLSHVGYLSDLITTDGSYIVDSLDFLHPNMVLPMLRGFGMTEEEDANVNSYYATWNALRESPLLKNLLFSYRDLTMRKGTSQGGTDYFATAFGISDLRFSVPENLLLTVRDSSPMDLETPGAAFDDRTSYSLVPRLPESSVMISGAQWTRQFTGDTISQTIAELWSDVFTDRWSNSAQDSLASATHLIPPVLGAAGTDPWTSIDPDYVQHTSFVYQLKVAAGGFAVLGSAWIDQTYDGVTFPRPDLQYSARLWDNPGNLTLRMRLLKEQVSGDTSTVQDVWLYADWSDIDGDYLGREYYSASVASSLNSSPNTWINAVSEVVPPNGARYVSWGVVIKAGTGSPLICVGAIHLSPFDVSTYKTYRNPRSVIMLVDYGTDLPSALQVINAAKAHHDGENHLPIQVTHRLITNLSEDWDTFSKPVVNPVDPRSPVYTSDRVSYVGGVFTAGGDPIVGTAVEYSQSTDLPDVVITP